MSSSCTRPPIRHAVIVFATASSLGVAACSMTTSPEVVTAPSTSILRASATTSESASLLEPPVMVQIPADIDPPADTSNPVEVAEAFVTAVTNREPAESDGSWRLRWSKWVTPALSASWGNDRGPDAYRVEVEGRDGLAVGMVVGSAVHGCDDTRCSVDVVADQTFLLEGHALNERNFVTWKLELRRETAGWLVDAVTFGAGS